MKKTYQVTWTEILERLKKVDAPGNRIYGIPKGGMIVSAFLKHATAVHLPELANLILDDLIDSGRTRDAYQTKYPSIPFYALFNKHGEGFGGVWIVFPWEADHPGGEDNIQENITRLLQYIGEDPEREGLKETPDRVIRAWDELFAGYKMEVLDLFKTFEDDQIGGMIYLKDIEFYSTCEHHMLPFSGKAHIGYIPNGRVIGVSKLARLLDVFARRLQIQERIAESVTNALMTYLEPMGAACIIEAVHLCIACRGVKKQHSVMGYSSMQGAFFEDARARAEFISLTK